MHRWLIVLALSAALASCGESPDIRIFTGPDVDAVRARHTALVAALNKKDAAAVAAFYDMSSLIFEPAQHDGRIDVDVRLNNDALLKDPLSAVIANYAEIEVSGDLAVSQGECIITKTDPDTHQARAWLGACMQSWRRLKDGVWRVGWESRNVLPVGTP